MECSEVKRQIDEMPFDNDFKPGKEVKSHLKNCPGCRKYYEKNEQITRIISNLKNRTPVLLDPDEMKSAILSSIENEKRGSGAKVFPILFMTRFLAAATVVLLMTLGIEQYTVLQKIQHLEIQFGKINQTTIKQNLRLYKASVFDIETLISNGKKNLSLKKLPLFLQLKLIVNSNFTYEDLKRNIDKEENLKKLINNQQQKLNP
jgi:hypothetical protein